MSWLARTGHRLPPHTTVVTDFVAHSQWIMPHVDRYCVAAPEVGHELIARGIPAERILVTGVPVRRRFTAPLDRAAARQALGLSLETPVALAMAGSQGSLGRLPDVARALLELGHPVQGLMVAGRDAHLAARLRSLTRGHPVRIFGYVQDMAPLMAAADLLVTKAGGMTVAEALAAQVPLVAFGSLPGQERRNERFASRAGIALRARSRHELVEVLERALAGPELLANLRQRMRRLGRPDAARRVVAAVLERTTA
jgi:processive 1,2-diacylglycerol beta-glucosyltransferase